MSELAGKTVMVTGGCGFVGSHLIRRLLAEGLRATWSWLKGESTP